MNRLSIRLRLTLWYAATFAILLIAFCFLIDALLRHRLLARTDFELDEEMHELALELQLAPSEDIQQRELETRFAAHKSFEFQVYSESGRCVFASRRVTDTTFPRPEEVPETGLVAQTAEIAGLGSSRIASRTVVTPRERLVAQVAIPLTQNLAEVRELRQIFFLVAPAMLIIASFGGYRLARRSLDPVDRMTRSAARITASQLDERLAVDNPDDELGRLSTTLNAMIDRLESSLNELRAFTADAAHEFRTPLCVIRNAAEVALMSPRTGDYYEKSLNGILEETARLTALSNQLLLLAREDAGLDRQNERVLDWTQLVRSILDDLEPLLDERELTVEHGDWPRAFVNGDPERLRRVALNLFDNAIKYTPPGGRITVRMEAASDLAALTIADTGVGIPAEDLPRVFERFYRSDASRTRETGGSGLGLAICKAIIERHNGTIRVESRSGEGTAVRIELPIARTAVVRSPQDSAVVSLG